MTQSYKSPARAQALEKFWIRHWSQIHVAATTLASNAKSMVDDATSVTNEGTAAAAAAQLATQEAAALKARQEAPAAIASFRQAHGPPLAQQNQQQAADHHCAQGDGNDSGVPVNPQANPPTVSGILELSTTIQEGVDAALGASSSHAVAAADAAAAQTSNRSLRPVHRRPLGCQHGHRQQTSRCERPTSRGSWDSAGGSGTGSPGCDQRLSPTPPVPRRQSS
jgi:hypothetical protein